MTDLKFCDFPASRTEPNESMAEIKATTKQPLLLLHQANTAIMPRSKGMKRERAMLCNAPHADVKRVMARRSQLLISTPVNSTTSSNTTGINESPPPSGSSHLSGALRPRRLDPQQPCPSPEDNFDDKEDEDYSPSEQEDDERATSDEDEEEPAHDTPNGSDDMSSLTPDEPPVTASSQPSTPTNGWCVADNVLTPWAETKACYEGFPCPKCLGGKDDETNSTSWKPSLLASAYTHGALTDIVITCNVCTYEKVVCPTIVKSNTDDSSDTPSTRGGSLSSSRRYKHWESKFKAYPINYNIVLLAHVLGCGTESIGTIFAFFGIAPGRGGGAKWKSLEDAVGEAEQLVSSKVCTENRNDAVIASEDKAKEDYYKWLATEDGRQSTQAMKVDKMRDLLHVKDGRVGVAVGMDGAWQRRAIGFGNGNSMSGHNFCVDLLTKKIINHVVYSKQCTTCTRYNKLGTPAPIHRCSENFHGSSKSMEADASVQHKVDLETTDTGLYVHTLCTDDDSSVRANTKYSLDDIARRDYPDYHGRNKHITDWPYTETTVNGKTTRTYAKDTGHLPLQCFPIHRYTTDRNHRVRCIGKFLFAKELQSKAKVTPPGKLSKEEALKLKKYAGYYLKQDTNLQLPFNEFCRRAPCMYLHHFNEHSLCNVQWCKTLKSQRTDGIQPTVLPVGYLRRFRHCTNDRKLLDKLQELYAPYLTEEALYQCYHAHDTNKNESLNRKCTAVAPKDRYLSGTMSL